MQYLLTSEEFMQLHDSLTVKNVEQARLIRNLCIDLANNKAILYWNNKEPKIWGCILTKTASYCDCCPVRKVCPDECKEYSK